MNIGSAGIGAVAALATILIVPPALAQTPPVTVSPSPSPSAPSDPCGSIISIVTRPSVTTSVCTVREGHVDVENGYSNTTTTGAGGGSTINYPQSFVRVGVGPHMEVSLSPPSFNRTTAGAALVSGSSDMNFGAKWELGYNSKASWGANVQLSAPTGTPGFTAGATQYTANINWSYSISSVWSASGTLGFNSLSALNNAEQYQYYSAFVPSIVFSASLPANSEAFAEYVYFSHAGPGLGGKSLIDFGYIHDWGSHVQFDVEYGFQPTMILGQKMHYFGAGVSFMN